MIPQAIGPYQASDDVEFEIDCVDAEGNPSDFQSVTAHFYVSRKAGDALVLTTDGSTPTATATPEQVSPPSGKVTIAIDGEDTAALLGTYDWRCVLEDALNNRQLVARGYVTFNARLDPPT